MSKHKILLTRILTQTIELDVELPNEGDCTDGVILAKAMHEATGYFDTDWRTHDIRYSYDLMDVPQSDVNAMIDAAFQRQYSGARWRKLSHLAQEALRRDIRDMMDLELIDDPATAVRTLDARIGGQKNLTSYIATLMGSNKRNISLTELG